MMRIVIDMQGAQTESRFRGIGRYSTEFARAVIRNGGDHEIIIVLSGLFPETIEPIRSVFEGLLPKENIRVWYAPGPVREEQPGNESRRQIAELIREAFIKNLSPDVVHIVSLFEGYADDAVTSIGCFDSQTIVSVTLYDLIPLLNQEHYLRPNPLYKTYYQRKIESLERASLLLAISNYARKEAVDALSINTEKVVTVSTAIENHFKKLDIGKEKAKARLEQYGIKRPFVLYTGGADERKNLPRLIEAYAKLPPALRGQHQLVFVGRMPHGDVERFKSVAHENGLCPDELVFSGYVGEVALTELYNLCKLYVFPSWHEGFGLPALEAMACGAAVIGANTSSLPEVIGLEQATFNPFDVTSIADKMECALSDENFRQMLVCHAEHQVKKFSWNESALVAIKAWEQAAGRDRKGNENGQPELEYHRLIGEIGKVLDDNNTLELGKLAQNIAHNEGASCRRQLLVDVSELCQGDAATGVQRVVRGYLYQLLIHPPKHFVVCPVYATRAEGYRYATRYLAKLQGRVLTDERDQPLRWCRGDIFFGLDMQHHVQLANAGTYRQLRRDGVTVKFLVHDLLPIQLAELFPDGGIKDLHEQWLAMIAEQDEAICVSQATADAYQSWIRENNISTNPRFRTSCVHNGADLEGAIPSVGMPENASEVLEVLKIRPTLLTVSTLEPRKAHGQILEAVENLWSEGVDVNLVFVGRPGWKVEALVTRITAHPELSKRLFWLAGISDEYLDHVYAHSICLIAASINEGFGLPLIEAARRNIPVIARDIPVFREVAGDSAFYFTGSAGSDLAQSIRQWFQLHRDGSVPSSNSMRWNTWEQSAEHLKNTLTLVNYSPKQLLVDVSELVQRDAKSGIRRVVRAILQQWLSHPPEGFRVEPVYARADQLGYCYARRFTSQFLGGDGMEAQDEPVDAWGGDVFIGLDLQPVVVPAQKEVLQQWRNDGVAIWFVIYDLLPILQHQYFPQGADTLHARWLRTVAQFDGVACISKSVAEEFHQWLASQGSIQRTSPINIKWFHLGADVTTTFSSFGMPSDANELLRKACQIPSFLMVGTVEPRKGHAQVIEAFEQLWADGGDLMLIIVGKQGWMVETLATRLRNHPEAGKNLHWLEGISDEYLEKVYEVATCLIAASYGEGFGLPLIEAAQRGVSIIARDIPVFREVAGDNAYYFSHHDPEGLVLSIREWLSLYKKNMHPHSDQLPWLTWQKSASQLLSQIGLQLGAEPSTVSS